MSDDPNEEAGRVLKSHPYNITDTTEDLRVTVDALMDSDSIDDRVHAIRALRALAHRLTLPAGTWAVVTDPAPDVIAHLPTVWSAHYTEADAHRWRDAYDEYIDGRARTRGWRVRNFYVVQVDYAKPSFLRRPDADALLCISRTHR